MKRIALTVSIAVVAVSLVILAGCGGSSGTSMTSTTSSAAGSGQTSEPVKSATVDISNFAFNPDSVTIVTGGKVIWKNSDSVDHTVTSDDGAFDSGQLATGATFSRTFDKAGTFTYHCTNHPTMTATVVVK